MKITKVKTEEKSNARGVAWYLRDRSEAIANNRLMLPILLMVGFVLSFAIPQFNLVNPYVQIIIMYIGINIILTTSLNIVNGYMGEFSIGHAGFMAVGAYVSSLLTLYVFPSSSSLFFFPLAVIAGGVVAALVSLIVAIPSFKTRGDYLAIITLAFLFIVKSVLENISAIGGPRGIGSIAGSILGATIYTVLLEVLRPLGMFRMVLMPLLLVFLMLYRPRGIMGLRELRWFLPIQDLKFVKRWRRKKGSTDGNSAS